MAPETGFVGNPAVIEPDAFFEVSSVVAREYWTRRELAEAVELMAVDGGEGEEEEAFEKHDAFEAGGECV